MFFLMIFFIILIEKKVVTILCGTHSLYFYRGFHWDLGSVLFSSPDCSSERAAVAKKMASSSHEEECVTEIWLPWTAAM